MKKKRATKDDNEVPLDMRRVIEAAFEAAGGQANFDAWAKRHSTMLYSMLMKLVPSVAQVSAQVDTHVTVHDDKEARAKLEDAFMRLIEAGRDSAGDPAVYVDGERIDDVRIINGVAYARIADQTGSTGRARATINGVDADRTSIDPRPATDVDTSPTRLHDEPKRAADPSARGTGHATADQEQVPRDERPSPEQNENISNLESDRDRTSRGLRSDQTVRARPVTAEPREPSTTQKYLDWANSGGGRRTRWDNNQ